MTQIFSTFQGLLLRLRLTWRLVNDDRVPLWTKMIPLITVGYIISPIDVLPDFLLIAGQLDDFVILVGGLELFERLSPADVVAEHRQLLLDDQEIKKDTLL